MIDKELLSYLELEPKDSKWQPNETVPEIKLDKTNRRLAKFLTKIPFTILYSSDHLAKLSCTFDTNKFDTGLRKVKYIGFNYEKYINNDNFVELNERYPKRKLAPKLENSIPRSCKKIKTVPKVCLIKTEKFSFEQILDNVKISKETRDFILKKINNTSKKNKKLNFIPENSDQAISIESQLGETLNQSQLSLYSNESSTVNQFNKANHNRESGIWFDYINYEEFENFYEHSKKIQPLAEQIKSIKKSKNPQRPDKPLANLNENFELIDLTNDII